MRLVGKEKIKRTLSADETVGTWVRAWVAEIASANWKEPSEVTQQFPNACHYGSGHFVFPISDSDKRVRVQIAFQQGIAVVTAVE